MHDDLTTPNPSAPMDNADTRRPHGKREGQRYLDPSVADILRTGRLRQGWSFRAAAKHTGVSAGYACLLEGGHRVPSVVVAEALVAGYGLTDAEASRLRAVAVVGVGRDWHEYATSEDT